MGSIIFDDKTIMTLARKLSSLANPTRICIVILLSEREMMVGDLCQVVGVSQSALSQHLTVLKKSGLVTARRDGRKKYYKTISRAITGLLNKISLIEENKSDSEADVKYKMKLVFEKVEDCV